MLTDQASVLENDPNFIPRWPFCLKFLPFKESKVAWSIYVIVMVHQFAAQDMLKRKVSLFIGHVGFSRVRMLFSLSC
jgi:hypothetical protein